MAKSGLTVKVNTIGNEIVMNLIEAIEKHYEDMPQDLKEIIRQAHETGIKDWGVDDYELYIGKNKIDRDEVKFSHDEVLKANKYLKKLYYADGMCEYVDSFTVKHGDTLIYGW